MKALAPIPILFAAAVAFAHSGATRIVKERTKAMAKDTMTEAIGSLPVDVAFAAVWQTCSACHESFRLKR